MTKANPSSERPLLTIAIPTWNRSKELQECIQLIAAEIDAVSEDVEIFVSDNASNDGTDALLCQMETRLGFLRYSRNESNLGVDRNFVEALKRSSGKYVWLFSDDDFMVKGSVAEILRIIKTYQPAYITTNYLYCDSLKRIVDSQPQRRFMVAKDIIHADINQMFAERNHWLSFVSCNIYRCDLLDIAEYEANINNVKYWIQVYMAAHVLSIRPDGYLSSFCAVLSRVGNARFNSLPFVKYMPEAFSYILNKYDVDEHVYKYVLEGIRATFLPFRSFLVHRSLGVEVSPLLIPHYYKLASLIPENMIRMAWKIKRFLARKWKGARFTRLSGIR